MHAFLVGKQSIKIATYQGSQAKMSIHSFEAHNNAKASDEFPPPMLLVLSRMCLHA